MKKIILSFLIIILCGGCWNYKELNDYALVTSMAIDYVDDKYLVSFLVLNGNKLENDSKDSKYKSVIYSGSGKTISLAIENASLVLFKELYIGHLNSLIISEEVAKRGIYNLLEYFLKDSQSKSIFYVFLAKDTNASDLLNITNSITNNYNEMQGSFVYKTYNDVLYDLVNDGIDTAISSYVIVDNKDNGVNFENKNELVPKTYIKIDDLGIFKGDKLVGYANYNQSRGINIINNNINNLNINIPCDDGYIVVDTNNLKTIRDISKEHIKIKTTGDASIKEVTCDIDINDNKNIVDLNKKINKEIRDIIYDGYLTARNMETDVFGLGLEYYRNNPLEYEKNNFNDIYLGIEPEVSVDIKFLNSDNIK